MENKCDLLIVGAGIFGLTIAERAANELGKNVLVIDKRNHIGGNAYSEFDKDTNIEVHKYGAHLFHTSNQTVWDYVNKFTKFTDYVHKVYTTHNNEVFPLPINLGTINQFFHAAYTPSEARDLIKQQAAEVAGIEPTNLKEQGISLIGKPLFEAFIMNYTSKQWQTPAEELDPSIIKRLPVRYTYNNNYFANTYEGLPLDGYEKWFQNMIDSAKEGKGSISIKLDTDYFDSPELQSLKGVVPTLFTGAIDRYFDYSEGELPWRSLDLVREIVDTDDFQGCPVMNYADLDAKWTRIHEFKHFHPERWGKDEWPGYSENFGKTVIVREYSKTWKQGDEPYYPVNTPETRELFAKYKKLAEAEKNENKVIFGGRLGEYAYYDMDNVFASALNKFEEYKTDGFFA
ncbi:MAG: UDP-galactopyranose mutase [Candidatus Ancillula sp.]|nr:UDP-galactopyranose mutase [Candidatus Ancillula sp.]